MTKKGLLLVISDPPAAFEEEFNAWYDTDHIPERLAIPGFETGRRFVSADREGRYLALYDLTTIGVLDSPGYLAFSGANFTPWSKRVVARCRIDRIAATQVFPGDQTLVEGSRLLLMRLTACSAETALGLTRDCFEGRSEVLQIRGFVDETPDRMHLLVSGQGNLAGLIDLQNVHARGIGIESVETYSPY